MSYPETAKDTNLHGLGWSTDSAYEEVGGSQVRVTNASKDNLGFMMRNQWYLEGIHSWQRVHIIKDKSNKNIWTCVWLLQPNLQQSILRYIVSIAALALHNLILWRAQAIL